MNQATFKSFCDIAYEMAGIDLGPTKLALVQARVAKRMRVLGYECEKKYLDFLKNDKTDNELVQFLDAISTNLTYFYREEQHFTLLEKILSKWAEQPQRRYRIWCAASSTGEEPYTLAMTMREKLPQSCDMRLLATDICTEVLDKAKDGVYTDERMKAVPAPLKKKYFTASKSSDGVTYEAAGELKKIILFKRLNLSVIPFPMKGPMDIVFCRNVMIYFDTKVRQRLIDEVYRLLKPGGYFFVGHSESLSSLTHSFKTVAPAVYRK